MKYHNTHDYLLNPQHKITVCLIGCGGTGSQVLSILGRMNQSLMALDHPGIIVSVYDDDIVTEANVGRQLFSESEIGLNKAVCLTTRMNRFYGTDWVANSVKFNNIQSYNIYISCVDDFKTRLTIGKQLKSINKLNHPYQPLYWLDFGNTNAAGQAILGTLYKEFNRKNKNEEYYVLKCFDEWSRLYEPPKKSDNTPSCSLAEALDKQDLMINSTLANAGMQLLWRLFREGKTPYNGIILNLDTLQLNPILIN